MTSAMGRHIEAFLMGMISGSLVSRFSSSSDRVQMILYLAETAGDFAGWPWNKWSPHARRVLAVQDMVRSRGERS